MNKKEIIDRVVQIAKSQVGTVETPKGSNKNKYSKFFDDLRKSGTKIYNGVKDGEAAWCDIFADYCYIQAVGVEIGPKMIYQPLNSCGAGVKFSAEYYRKNKAFYTSPEVGDQIFYGKDGKPGTETHTGIVVKLTDKTIYTVEGNTGDQVKAKTVSRSQIGKKVVGFGRPNWELAVKAESDEQTTAEKPQPKPTPTAKKVHNADVTPTSMSTKYNRTFTVNAVHGLNLRKGPGTNFAKLTCMPYKTDDKRTTVKCSGKHSGAWLFVTYETKTDIYNGFCMMKYLK